MYEVIDTRRHDTPIKSALSWEDAHNLAASLNGRYPLNHRDALRYAYRVAQGDTWHA